MKTTHMHKQTYIIWLKENQGKQKEEHVKSMDNWIIYMNMQTKR